MSAPPDRERYLSLQKLMLETAQAVRTHLGKTAVLYFWAAVNKASTIEGKQSVCEAALLKIRLKGGGHNDD